MSDDERDKESQVNPTELPDQLAGLLTRLREAGQESFRRAIADKGGARRWCASMIPIVAKRVIENSSEQIALTEEFLLEMLLSETESFWVGVNVRLEECARCPLDGAACDETRNRIPAGRTVLLVLPRTGEDRPAEGWSLCERYKDFRVSRKLQSYGVDKRLSRMKLQLIEREPRKEILDAFHVFLDSGSNPRAPSQVELIIEGKLAREYGAALFRNTLLQFTGAEARSVHAPTLVTEAKDAVAMKQESPLKALLEPQVLLIDGIDNALLRERWGLTAIQRLLDRRRDQQQATIVTATCPVKEVFPSASVLRV